MSACKVGLSIFKGAKLRREKAEREWRSRSCVASGVMVRQDNSGWGLYQGYRKKQTTRAFLSCVTSVVVVMRGWRFEFHTWVA